MKNFFTLIIVFTTIVSYGQNSTIRNWPSNNNNIHKNAVIHNNYKLDNTLNYFDADIAATYRGCENKKTNIEKTNCFFTNLTIFTIDGLSNSTIIKNSNFTKGTKKIRVLLIIDETGNIHVIKVLGKWSKSVSQEIAKIVESAPKLIPAKLSGQNIPVKFSIKVPFTVK